MHYLDACLLYIFKGNAIKWLYSHNSHLCGAAANQDTGQKSICAHICAQMRCTQFARLKLFMDICE